MKTAFAAILAAVLLQGCADNSWARSDDRWRALHLNPDTREWALCVDRTSSQWLAALSGIPQIPPAGETAPETLKMLKTKTSWQVFVQILSACEPRMVGKGWREISFKQQQSLMSDAYIQYEMIESEIEQSQIDYSAPRPN
jgi:hypothetical protein